MDEIARRSEFSVGSLYRFFGSKEELVEALLVSRIRAWHADVDALSDSPEPFEVILDLYLVGHVAFFERNFPLVHFLFTSKRPMFKGEGSAFHEVFARGVAAVARLLDRGGRDGVLGDEPPETMAVVLLSLIDGLARSAWMMGQRDHFRDIVPVARRAFLDGFRRR